MFNLKWAKAVSVALVACAATCTIGSAVYADDAQDTKALKEQMRLMQQRLDEMQKQLETMSKRPAPEAAPSQGPSVAKEKAEKPEVKEPLFEKFMSGFYGTLDVSLDDTTKGINGLVAYHYAPVGTNPFGPYQIDPANPNPKSPGPVGRVGYMPALSTNKSVLGYRGSYKIAGSGVDFIYQIEAQPAITASPGLNTSQYQQSNITKAGIGYGDTFIGFSGNEWGKIKFGTTYSPYKKSTDRMNPFSGMLGDYSVVMGNSGGDNRVEFGTRLDHSIWYESPKFAGFTANVLYSPGQNRSSSSDNIAAGESDCTGGNIPGSGGTGGAGIGPVRCNDGSFSDA